MEPGGISTVEHLLENQLLETSDNKSVTQLALRLVAVSKITIFLITT